MMHIGGPERGWGVSIGRDHMRDARCLIQIGVGFRADAHPGEIRWKWWRSWSSASLPGLVYRQFYWKGWKVTLPIGYYAFGRWHVFM